MDVLRELAARKLAVKTIVLTAAISDDAVVEAVRNGTVIDANGTKHTAAVVVGADGYRSAVRGSVLRDRDVATIHSREASLDDVFVEITGRQLT